MDTINHHIGFEDMRSNFGELLAVRFVCNDGACAEGTWHHLPEHWTQAELNSAEERVMRQVKAHSR